VCVRGFRLVEWVVALQVVQARGGVTVVTHEVFVLKVVVLAFNHCCLEYLSISVYTLVDGALLGLQN
jgi:hypothetical protein